MLQIFLNNLMTRSRIQGSCLMPVCELKRLLELLGVWAALVVISGAGFSNQAVLSTHHLVGLHVVHQMFEGLARPLPVPITTERVNKQSSARAWSVWGTRETRHYPFFQTNPTLLFEHKDDIVHIAGYTAPNPKNNSTDFLFHQPAKCQIGTTSNTSGLV